MWLNISIFFLITIIQRILALALLIFIKVMIVDFISQRLKLEPYFTDLSQKSWLYFICSIAWRMEITVFRLFESFIIFTGLIQVLDSRFFGHCMFYIVDGLIFFIFEAWEDIRSGRIRLKRVRDNFNANVDQLFEGDDVLVLGYLIEKGGNIWIVDERFEGHISWSAEWEDELRYENSS